MFRPDGITLDLGSGKHKYVAFERSASMSRNARLSFIRADFYDAVRKRITLDLDIRECELSKLYAYNGLMFSSGVRVELNDNSFWNRIVVIKKCKDIYEKIREMNKLSQVGNDPNHIYSMTMEELFDTVYGTKPPVIENILTPGMYVIAGTPKVGKSFLMAQIAYYVSMGIPLWNNIVNQGTVLYLALEDRYDRL